MPVLLFAFEQYQTIFFSRVIIGQYFRVSIPAAPPPQLQVHSTTQEIHLQIEVEDDSVTAMSGTRDR